MKIYIGLFVDFSSLSSVTEMLAFLQLASDHYPFALWSSVQSVLQHLTQSERRV